jgi:hypothetical protein
MQYQATPKYLNFILKYLNIFYISNRPNLKSSYVSLVLSKFLVEFLS